MTSHKIFSAFLFFLPFYSFCFIVFQRHLWRILELSFCEERKQEEENIDEQLKLFEEAAAEERRQGNVWFREFDTDGQDPRQLWQSGCVWVICRVDERKEVNMSQTWFRLVHFTLNFHREHFMISSDRVRHLENFYRLDRSVLWMFCPRNWVSSICLLSCSDFFRFPEVFFCKSSEW